jgi:hypothetical protein
MGPVTRFGNAVADTFGEIKEALGLQKHAAIGRMRATGRNAPLRPTPFFQRLSRQMVAQQDGRPLQNKATTCLSFGHRFQLLVFSTRLRFTRSRAGLESLKEEVRLFKKALKSAALAPAPHALTSLIASIDSKLVQKDPQRSIPAAHGSTYGGW